MASTEAWHSRGMSRHWLEVIRKDVSPQGTFGSPVIFTPKHSKKSIYQYYFYITSHQGTEQYLAIQFVLFHTEIPVRLNRTSDTDPPLTLATPPPSPILDPHPPLTRPTSGFDPALPRPPPPPLLLWLITRQTRELPNPNQTRKGKEDQPTVLSRLVLLGITR